MRINCIPHGLITLQCIFPRNKGILFHDHIMDKQPQSIWHQQNTVKNLFHSGFVNWPESLLKENFPFSLELHTACMCHIFHVSFNLKQFFSLSLSFIDRHNCKNSLFLFFLIESKIHITLAIWKWIIQWQLAHLQCWAITLSLLFRVLVPSLHHHSRKSSIHWAVAPHSPPPSSPWQLPDCLLSLCSHLFWIFLISETSLKKKNRMLFALNFSYYSSWLDLDCMFPSKMHYLSDVSLML